MHIVLVELVLAIPRQFLLFSLVFSYLSGTGSVFEDSPVYQPASQPAENEPGKVCPIERVARDRWRLEGLPASQPASRERAR